MKETINLKAVADLVEISDGYHTFSELYDHRIQLYITLCKYISFAGQFNPPTVGNQRPVWCSKLHADGSAYDGWFILGIKEDLGKQVSYHVPISRWNDTEFAETLAQAPEWDGHTSADVLERLKSF